MEFIIDNREAAIKSAFQEMPYTNVKYANMDIGDIGVIWNGDLRMVFERKSLADLGASIKDGRHREQKARLLEWRAGSGTRRIYYIIESVKGFSSLDTSALVGSVMNTLFRDDIPVIFTKDEADTVRFCKELYTRCSKDDLYFKEVKGEGGEVDYISSVKLKKNKNITPQNVFIYQLSQIPGVSTKIATAIVDRHPTMMHFARALFDKTTLERVAYVKAIQFEVGEGKTRKVGDKTAAKIVEFVE